MTCFRCGNFSDEICKTCSSMYCFSCILNQDLCDECLNPLDKPVCRVCSTTSIDIYCSVICYNLVHCPEESILHFMS